MNDKLITSSNPNGSRMWIIRGPLRNVVKDEEGEVVTFASKKGAKAFRDVLGDNFCVSPGPDHTKWLR